MPLGGGHYMTDLWFYHFIPPTTAFSRHAFVYDITSGIVCLSLTGWEVGTVGRLGFT